MNLTLHVVLLESISSFFELDVDASGGVPGTLIATSSFKQFPADRARFSLIFRSQMAFSSKQPLLEESIEKIAFMTVILKR